jgi:hypothetical protein
MGVKVDETTDVQVRDMTSQLVQQMLARDETVPLESDPIWPRGQAAMGPRTVIGSVDLSITVLHAQKALADDWPEIAVQLRARL